MDYEKYLEEKEKEYENMCKRCGACCGAYDDPCKHLKLNKEGKYYCEIYEKRFGLRETIKGEKFYCVEIRKILNSHWKKDYLCGYKIKSKFI
ncbi:MAG: hypothetical protein NC822_02990 [Candidatus Omnitrophica bacterium]|nr:hypothetical protein [Candidatus Omnitrophota bacterium]MCM8827427.1 hypothetical protein [Candidatus Omnitrophota bacterium]